MKLKRKKPIHQEPLAICNACGSETFNDHDAERFENVNTEIEVLNRAVSRAARLTKNLQDERNKFLLILAQCAIAQGIVRVDARTIDAIMDGAKSPKVSITLEPKLIAMPGDVDAMDYVVRIAEEEAEEVYPAADVSDVIERERERVANQEKSALMHGLTLVKGGGDGNAA